MKDDREVSQHDAQEFAASIGANYFETSAMTKEGNPLYHVHLNRGCFLLFLM